LHTISNDLGLPKSSTLAICRTLVSTGLLVQDDRGMYGLSIRIVRIAGTYIAGIDVAQVFNRVLDTHSSPDRTIALAVLDGTQVVFLTRRDGVTSFNMPSTTGRALPASSTAVGKAMLAHLPEDLVRDLYRESPLPRSTPRSITSVDDLIIELRQVKERGFSTDRGETVHGILGVGAPVWSFGEGFPVAAVSIAGEDNIQQDELIDQFGLEIRQVADAISSALGVSARSA
jgi:DNA-binding IclR family transcriptional regulator